MRIVVLENGEEGLSTLLVSQSFSGALAIGNPRENPEQRNEYCRSLITRKIEATIITLEKSIPRSDKWEPAMKLAYTALSRLEEIHQKLFPNCVHCRLIAPPPIFAAGSA
jgi:hypothetical protein